MKHALLGALAILALSATPAHADGLMLVTGYTCAPAQGQPYCGLTADGTHVQPGVAACPSRMPFGTAVHIEGVGDVVCHDRGPENAIDVWFPSMAACYAVTGWYPVQVVG